MLGIGLMVLGGFAIGWAIYDHFDDDDDGRDNDQDLRGTEADDRLEGDSGNDAIEGLGGDDNLLGQGGNDRIAGGEGDDIGLGGAGEDTVFMLQGESTDPARVTDYTAAEDALIYVYEGAEEPEIEITDNGDGTYDILADGAVLAVVRSDATLTADMITLYSTGSDAADSAA